MRRSDGRNYALYRGDELLDVGTLREIAERQGVKEQTVYYYSTPSYRRRCDGSEDRLLAVLVEGEGA